MNEQDFTNTEVAEEPETSAGLDLESAERPQEGQEEPLSTKAMVVIKKGEETILEYTIETLPVKIGRKGGNEIVLEEKNVSRNHAQIMMKEDQYFIEDLGSTGGTNLNGEQITEKDIHTGDVIGIGNYQLHFNSGIPEDERTVFETSEETVLEEGTAIDEDRTMFYEEPETRLIVVKSENLEGEISLEEEEILLGRSEEIDVTVDDKRVSREHCKISRVGNDFVISDLGSSNGTFVNGLKVTEKPLENGDRIQIGSNVFEFRIEKPAVPQRKAGVGIFAKVAVGVVLLAGLSFVVYKVVPSLRPIKAQKVILQKLWEHTTQAAVSASPSLGDLNGDGYVNMAVADVNGIVYGLDGRQGGLIWNSEFRSGGAVLSSPLLVDINERDGELDVVVGTTTKGVMAIDGGTMRQIWVGRVDSAVPSTAAASDINGDGTRDVFIGTSKGSVICLDGRQGGTIWKFETGAPVKTSPVLCDFNGDIIPDVIIGSTDNKLYCLDGKNGSRIWVHAGTGEPSKVACADFNGDKNLDVAFVTPKELVVLEGQKGSILWTWSLPASALPTDTDPFVPFPPVVTDLNNDKMPDVIFSTPGGHIYAVDGTSKGVKYIWDFGLTSSRKTAPSLCDFNGDRTVDIAVGDADGNLTIIDGKTGHQLNTLHVGGEIVSPPVIGDFTSNGTVDIAVGTQQKNIIAIQTETRIKKNQIVWNSF